MDAQTISNFVSELDNIIRTTGSNQQAHIFAQRARNVVTNAYDGNAVVRWQQRPGVDTTNADKLITMGKSEAVFGRGRSLLRK